MPNQHTPGPWQHGPVFQKEGRAIFITDTSKPGKWQRRLDDKSGVFSEADSRLIATAPELLAALEGLATWLIAPDLSPEVIGEQRAMARAAIAKASGQEG